MADEPNPNLDEIALGLEHARETWGRHCTCENLGDEALVSDGPCPLDAHQHAALANLSFLAVAIRRGEALEAFDQLCNELGDVAFVRQNIKDGPKRYRRKKKKKPPTADTVEEKGGEVHVGVGVDIYKTVPIGTIDGTIFYCGGCETQPKRDKRTRQIVAEGHMVPLRIIEATLGADMPTRVLVCPECRAIVKPGEAFAVIQGALEWLTILQDQLAPPSKEEREADRAELDELINKPKAEEVETGLVDGRGNKITKRAKRDGDSPIVSLS